MVHRVAVALVKYTRRELLTLDMEGLVQFLQRGLQKEVSDVDAVMKMAFQLQIKQADIDAYEADYWRTVSRR